MRKRFLKTAAAMMAIGLAVSTCSVTALADGSDSVGSDVFNVGNGLASLEIIGSSNTNNLPDNDQEKTKNDDNYNKNTADITTNNGNINDNSGHIGTNNGEIKENNSYIGTNNGEIKENNKEVGNNNGKIGDNSGTVSNNYGDIKDNKAADPNEYSKGGYVEYNAGNIEKNEGNVSTNAKDGTIGTNEGNVWTNSENGTITKNSGDGYVWKNNGTIKENSANDDTGDQQHSAKNVGVQNNNGTIEDNSGFVANNNGTIEDNSGFVEKNGVTDSYKDSVSDSDSDIGNLLSNNSVTEPIATIGNNTGTVQYNGAPNYSEDPGAFDENALVINMDGGLVYMNNGIVENHTGGEVTFNNGVVYNYGGEVTGMKSSIPDSDSMEYGIGTEYFSVSVSTKNGSQVYGQGFKDYDEKKWLGQSYNEKDSTWTTSSSEVTITPTSGYEIASLNIPDKYSEYVSATKNSDGTWTLSVKSGYNISLTPTATLIATSTLDNSGNSGIPGTSGNQGTTAVSVEVSVSSDSDSGSNDSGNKPAQNSNNDFQVSPPGSMMNQMMINSVDFIGQGLSAPLSEVLQKIDNITAINNFQAMGRVIPSNENIMACGVVDFKNAFVNAATGNVDVPVEATVIAGNTYTVALSDGTIIEVQCTTNGILNIPFAANAQNLTFIIYGVQSNPFTASLE